MPRVNIFQLALLDHGPLHNITSLLYSLGIVWNAIVDVLLHILHSRPLPHIPPRLVGNTLLCSLCRAIFETHAIATYHLDHWKAYRHQDDIALLQLSANSGCQICTRLLVWIGSIENDPGWLKLSRLPWGFTIRSQLLKTEVHNQFEVLFTIFRFGPWYAKYEDMCYRLKLRIIPIEEVGNLNESIVISSDTRSTASLALIKKWINVCDTEHVECERQRHCQNSWLPTRLIYVGEATSASTPRLCCSSTLPKSTKYIALSHCWGKGLMKCLINENFNEFQQSLPLSQLSPTFADALDLTRSIGVEYIWIDSLCIIQDSESDWATESATMSEVYGNSYCNIAATGFPNGDSGIHSQRGRETLQLTEIQVQRKPVMNYGLPNGSYYCIDDFWNEGVTNAPLNHRAWVFQERHLSPRIVHFGTTQLFWECRETEACEIFPSALPAIFATNFKKESAFQAAESTTRLGLKITMWCDTVSAYSATCLTYPSDKLSAISGLARRMHWSRHFQYYAGIWEVGIVWMLLWITALEGKRINNQAERPQKYRAPSWSWASVEGVIEFVDREALSTPWVRILAVDVTLVDNDEFGRVAGGHIQLRGHLLRAEFIETEAVLNPYLNSSYSHPLLLRSQNLANNLEMELTMLLDVFPPYERRRFELETHINSDYEAIGSREFFLMPLTYYSLGGVIGLILEKTGVKGQFRRLGLFRKFIQGVVSMLANHRPALDPDDYKVYYEEDGQCAITII